MSAKMASRTFPPQAILSVPTRAGPDGYQTIAESADGLGRKATSDSDVQLPTHLWADRVAQIESSRELLHRPFALGKGAQAQPLLHRSGDRAVARDLDA